MIEWLERHLLYCPVKYFYGVPCPGCGIQRAVIELLKGNIYKSIEYYPALITLIVMFLFLILHLIFEFKNGAKFLKIIFIINALIIFLNYFWHIAQFSILN